MGLSDIDEDDGPIVPPPPSAMKQAAVVPVPSTTAAAAPSASQSSPKNVEVNWDDLFGDMNISSGTAPTTLSPATTAAPDAARAPAPVSKGDDFLDSLFSAPAGSPAGSKAPNSPSDRTTSAPTATLHVGSPSTPDEDDLLDFKGAKKEKFRDAEAFLEMFAGKGKGSERFAAKDSLNNLTQNKDDNKVRARLLALMDYYDVLGVAHTASEEEIRRSYKKKALELHPDRVGREQTADEAELFKMITKANEVLTDPELRRKYDDELKSKQGGVAGAQGAGSNWFDHLKPTS